jgi:hypothetical protein
MAAPTDQRDANRRLIALAPFALFAGVVVVWMAIDRFVTIGPLDRAQLGWIIAVPLTLAIPVVAAWAGRQLGRSWRPAIALALGLVGGFAVAWPFWVSYASQCAAVGLPVPVGPIVFVGSIAGITLGGAVIAAGVAFDRGRPGIAIPLAALAAAIVFVVGFAVFALTWAELFFGECVVRPSITP